MSGLLANGAIDDLLVEELNLREGRCIGVALSGKNTRFDGTACRIASPLINKNLHGKILQNFHGLAACIQI